MTPADLEKPIYKGKAKASGETPLEIELLAFAGDRVCLPRGGETDEKKLLAHGECWYPIGVKLMVGEQSQCHRNSALMWEANRDKVRIATGYALSDDGIWRQHSWCVTCDRRSGSRGGRVVETTEKRLLYFGVCLSDELADDFLYANE